MGERVSFTFVRMMIGKGISDSRAVVILTYHSLDDSGSVISVTPQVFAEQMRILYDSGVRVVALNTIQALLGGNASNDPLVAITFDDGFRSVYEHAFPVLHRYGFPATIFPVTDYCGKTNNWPSQPLHIKRYRLLTWEEMREMSQAGITIGSHTRTHPDLTTLPNHRIEEELIASKRQIEDTIGRPVDVFAYPYGVYNDAVRNIVQSYFALSCSTALGFVSRQSDLFALERLDICYVHRPVMFRALFSKKMDMYIHFRRIMRDLRIKCSKNRKNGTME